MRPSFPLCSFSVVTRLVLIGAMSSAVSGCTNEQSARVRPFTYGRDFRFDDEQEVASAMQRMSVSVRKLDAALKSEGAEEDARQAEAVRLLDALQADAMALRYAERVSNHPRLTENLDAFLDEVSLARAAAARKPPNYYLAGSITGACMHCHAPVMAR